MMDEVMSERPSYRKQRVFYLERNIDKVLDIQN
jgi:hypothetical protein